MESQHFEKQMFSNNRWDIIFDARKILQKQFDSEKYIKPNFYVFQMKQHQQEPFTIPTKKGQHLSLAITSTVRKELHKKYQNLRNQFSEVKQRRVKMPLCINLLQKFNRCEDELLQYRSERERLQNERLKLQQHRQELKLRIQQLREHNKTMRKKQSQRTQEICKVNMEYLHDMIMAMRYQNDVLIDTDIMTYEQLLELEQKIGNVSKGITEEQITKIEKIMALGLESELCSICYYNLKEDEQVNKLPCGHYFHVNCIKEWLLKEKRCPLCKSEIYPSQLLQK